MNIINLEEKKIDRNVQKALDNLNEFIYNNKELEAYQKALDKELDKCDTPTERMMVIRDKLRENFKTLENMREELRNAN